MPLQIIDIGANLTNKAFEHDYESVIERAIEAGVCAMVITSSSIQSAQSSLALAEKKPGVLYSTAGVHPHDARFCNDNTLADIRSLLREKQVVALGECGLDFNRNYSPQQVQERWFEAQVDLACELAKPVFLHERDAHVRFTRILDSFGSRLPQCVVHCFTGTKEELFVYLDRGYYIGITGWICDERRGLGLKGLVADIPLDRLMIETDAPYLVPRTIHPKPKNSRNEPAFLTYVLQTLSGSIGKSIEEIAFATRRNSMRFFGIEEKKG
jgi:TatD DNase family protein